MKSTHQSQRQPCHIMKGYKTTTTAGESFKDREGDREGDMEGEGGWPNAKADLA